MRHNRLVLLCSIFAALLLSGQCWSDTPTSAKNILVVQGKVLDSTGSPVEDASVLPYLNGRPFISPTHGAGSEKEYLHRPQWAVYD